jgi:ParB-like chromosome segregation protein Spo0J
MKKKSKYSEKVQTEIYEMMDELPLPISEIARRVGRSYNTACLYLLRLVIKEKVIETEIDGIRHYYIKQENELNV